MRLRTINNDPIDVHNPHTAGYLSALTIRLSKGEFE